MWLQFERVTKFYGPVIGVNDISCRVGPGITGLFGANGAGKSTLMKLASGQLRPSQGHVRLGDWPAWSAQAKWQLGFSPDINTFYEEMTGREFVYAMTRLYGYSARESRQRTEWALNEVGMTDRAERRIAGCSHGMRQRIKLAQALVNDPAILLLDEPMSGIDPGGRRELGTLLKRLADQGKTVLVSSHILVEIESLADAMLMIARGRIIASGTIREVRDLIDDQPFTVELRSSRSRPLASLLTALPTVQSIEIRDQNLIVRTRNPQQFFSAVTDLVLEHDFDIERMETLDTGADAVFDYLQQGQP
jgi:ABC-2 type transport system ATP-binding protein